MQEGRYPVGRSGERPRLRLTHADRDAVGEALREAYSLGQLDEREFEERLELAMLAKFHEDLEPLTRDLGPAPRVARDPERDSDRPQSTPAERVIAAGGHVGNYFFPLVVPMVLFLVSDKSSPYVRRQAMEALNFQLFCLITAVVSGLLFWLIAPLLVLVYVALAWTVLPAVAGVATLTGRQWRYPLMFRVLKDD
ncbi:DUF1707 and DUF4870 domain-containing protein [Nocardiopsis sp. LOL_012]|uniref:DUF1707 and DUF4870 domain-containing protein n=1 Tax=Nocardiopsis sp. LOL_012 TaxID=3345409 RepID=UPI003A846B92